MERLIENLELLGEDIARVSDREANPQETLSAARARLFDATARPRRLHARHRPLLSLALAALVLSGATAVAVLSLRNSWGEASLTYVVSGDAMTASNAFVETKSQGSELRFSDGSRVNVLPESGVRILQTRGNGATLSVERGTIRCHVVGRKSTDWTVRAGPFDVHVIGTRFATQWNPEAGRFELSLEEGSVDVTGPQLTLPQRVVGGERLVVNLHPGSKSLTHGPREQDAPLPGTQGSSLPQLMDEPALGQVSSASPRVETTPPRSLNWEDLARAGRYREALTQIEALGFDAVLKRADVQGARLLADTARMAGAPTKATRALLALRKLHGVRAETAFLLGKISADQLANTQEALTWFDTYLREEPRGPLREQALGRSLELGRNAGAVSLRRAQSYLEAYPTGAYAPLARSIVQQRATR